MPGAASFFRKLYPLCYGNLVLRSHWTTQRRAIAKAHKWELQVQPFWFMNILVEKCNIKIIPFDPNENPNADQLMFNLNSESELNKDDYCVEHNEQEKWVRFSQKLSNVNYETHLTVRTPPAFNIDILSKGHSDIHVSTLECDTLNIKSQTGNITLSHIKGTQITAETGLGDIQSGKLLQGNLSLQTEKGEINLKQIQSCSAELLNRCGSLIVQDVYTDKLSAKCKNGHVQFKSLHGDSFVEAEGNIDIGTTEGCLNAVTSSGNIDVHIVDHQSVKLNSEKGDIALSVAPELNATVQLKAKNVDVQCDLNNTQNDESEVIEVFGCEGPVIDAQASQGNITMKTSSWMNRIVKFRSKT